MENEIFGVYEIDPAVKLPAHWLVAEDAADATSVAEAIAAAAGIPCPALTGVFIRLDKINEDDCDRYYLHTIDGPIIVHVADYRLDIEHLYWAIEVGASCAVASIRTPAHFRDIEVLRDIARATHGETATIAHATHSTPTGAAIDFLLLAHAISAKISREINYFE